MEKITSVVFFGSGPVAARSLKLLSSHFTIEAIITKPSTISDMHAVYEQAPLYTVTDKQELNALFSTTHFYSRLAVLVDFGIIVSRLVLDSFSSGIINSHFSLLPQWRGADPITFSILSGQYETGISVMLVTEGMDEGPLLAQAPYIIPEGATTPSLTTSLIELSDTTLKRVLPQYLKGTISLQSQDQVSLLGKDTPPSYSRKLTKKDGIIDWSKPAIQLEREVRAFISWPKSTVTLANREVVITEASVSDLIGAPGSIVISDRRLYVCCSKKALELKRLKPAGKADMSAEAFLAGYRQFL